MSETALPTGNFYCARYLEEMSGATCLAWQTENEGAESADELPHIGCDDCDQGDEIRIADSERREQDNKTRRMKPDAIAQARDRIATLGRKLGKGEKDMNEGQEPTGKKAGGTKTCHIGTCSNCGWPGSSIPNHMTTCHRCNKFVSGTRGNPKLRAQHLAEARELYRDIPPGQKLPNGAMKAKLAGGAKSEKSTLGATAPVEERPRETAPGGAAHPSSPGGSLREVEVKSPAAIAEEERFAGVLLETAEPHTVIPVTLRLTVEIVVKVNGIQA